MDTMLRVLASRCFTRTRGIASLRSDVSYYFSPYVTVSVPTVPASLTQLKSAFSRNAVKAKYAPGDSRWPLPTVGVPPSQRILMSVPLTEMMVSFQLFRSAYVGDINALYFAAVNLCVDVPVSIEISSKSAACRDTVLRVPAHRHSVIAIANNIFIFISFFPPLFHPLRFHTLHPRQRGTGFSPS